MVDNNARRYYTTLWKLLVIVHPWATEMPDNGRTVTSDEVVGRTCT